MRPDYRFPPKPIDKPHHISILLPTRARPAKLNKVFECFQTTIENKHLVDVWLYVDDDDEITLEYIKTNEWRKYGIEINWHISKSTKSMGEMLNQLWQRCTTNPGIYFPFCDDYFIETPGWDVILRDFMARQQDGIMLGYLIDPLHASYQVTIPVPSAQWLNVLGYFVTNRFFFWFDDMWLDRIADMAQRKVLMPIRVISQDDKGKTPRLRNLPFWNRYFACTADDRFMDAEKLLKAIHKNDELSLASALQNARESAAIHLHKSNLIKLDSEKNSERALSDLDHAPSASQLLDYFEAELFAVEDILLKVKPAMERSELSDALFLLNALEFSSFSLPEINYIKATLFQSSGHYSSAAKSLLSHIDINPDDIRSFPLLNKINDKPESCFFEKTSAYLQSWLGIEDDYFIYFPSKIDEEIYFIIQASIYLLLNHDKHLNSILVVGAGCGDGTVQAIVSAYHNLKPNVLFCIESNQENFEKLEKKYAHISRSYNCSSVSTSNYITERELTAFYKYVPSVMNNFPLELFTEALRNEKCYLDSSHRSHDCISEIKLSQNIDHFDFVVLDGSIFSGEADLNAVYGSTYIFLTSVKSIKDYANFKKLSEDENYILLLSNTIPRAGYALFGLRDQ